AKGREEGREEGLRLGALAILLRQVEMKFGAISDGDKARLSQFDSDQIIRASARILTATIFEEIL
ncbi:MAG: transposase, partial [Myxococcales bacterium]|nr:transposase [Myxococcales bacterium]